LGICILLFQTWVSGPAIAFGLLDFDAGRRALEGLERLRDQVGLGDARLGLTMNLLPIKPDDQMLSRLLGSTYPTFEKYTDGALNSISAAYYLHALSIYGLCFRAERLAQDLSEGYETRMFTGGTGSGYEFRSWEGIPTGYEGTMILSLSSLYAIAVEQGILKPLDPEWWPSDPV